MGKLKTGELGVAIAFIAVCIIWGSTYLAMRVAVRQFPPMLFAGMRFLTAGLLVVGFSAVKKYKFPATRADILKTSVTGILLLLGCNGLVMWAEQWIDSGIAALLLGATPLFTAVIESIFLKENKLGLVGWACLFIGFIGVSMLIITGMGIGSIDIKGGIIMILASLFWSVGSVYSKKVKASGDTIPQVGIQMVAAGISLSSFGLVIGESAKVQVNSSIILAFLYLVIFGSIIAYSSNMYVLSKWPASVASSVSYVNPVIAVILGALLLGEKLSLRMVFFIALTLGGVILLQFSRLNRVKIIEKE